MRYDGTRATLRADFSYGQSEIEIHDHLTGRREKVAIPEAKSGHGGGDWGLVRGFVRAVSGECARLSVVRVPLTSARASLESHLMAFAAEEARVEGGIVSMDGFRQRVEATPAPGGK